MDKPLVLSKDEQICFMRAIYSVFFRDENINDTEKSVLRLLNECFNLSTKDYKHYVHINEVDIAKEINSINDIRVRVYFMRIILDVYREEIKEWFKGAETDHAKQFRKMYDYLQNNIDLKSNLPVNPTF
jgi:hypothetical protein